MNEVCLVGKRDSVYKPEDDEYECPAGERGYAGRESQHHYCITYRPFALAWCGHRGGAGGVVLEPGTLPLTIVR